MFLMPGSFAEGKGKIITAVAQAMSPILDAAFGKQQGSILYRGQNAWAPLAPGTANQVLQTNGAGANPSWVTPAKKLLNSYTFPGATNTFNDTTSFTTAFNDYEVVWENLVPATGTALNLLIRFYQGGTLISGATSYVSALFGVNSSGGTGSSSSFNPSGTGVLSGPTDSSPIVGASGRARLFNFTNPATMYRTYIADGITYASSLVNRGNASGILATSQSALNGIQLLFNTGPNINAGGIVKVYGLL